MYWSALIDVPGGEAEEGKERQGMMDGCEYDPYDDKCAEASSAI